ncbi:cob(I)yrinic acid a,c-diamide adenosyltransferase [Nesterenkonia sp. MY13]|uniref:Cob(I)yrinic acid a,c-diamide adenosyltransferase n=1 Tax=Nesterenkonia sedimenti TaxID=1463632 RepID=A0A7X8YCH3_9MICC|nr:cob(I)yrinic acid a,c-diamide adenosyltransferase [Nesterenkonia sedimenti]
MFSPGLTWGRRDPRELCLEAWSAARTALESPAGGLVILDEISGAADHGWLQAADIASAVNDRYPQTSVIMTGKPETPELIETADTVIRFDLLKHDERLGKPMTH